MKTMMSKFLLGLILVGLSISLGFAQDTTSQSKSKSDIKNDHRLSVERR